MDERPGIDPGVERRLDALLRPALLVEPPPDVQQAMLAAVLLATAQPAPRPVAAAVMPEESRSLPLTSYLLLAAVLVAYVAALSWFQTFVGNAGWIAALVGQLLAAGELLFGRPTTAEPLAVLWLVFQRAPWLALLPVAWLLWERDKSARVA